MPPVVESHATNSRTGETHVKLNLRGVLFHRAMRTLTTDYRSRNDSYRVARDIEPPEQMA